MNFIESIKTISPRQKQRILILSFVSILIVGGLFVLNAKYGWTDRSTIEIVAPIDSVIIYINESIGGTIKDTGSSLLKSVRPGEYTIIAHSENHWPWKKDLKVGKQEVISLRPFLIPEKISFEKIDKKDASYQTLIQNFRELKSDTDITIMSSDSKTKIIANSDKIVIESENGDCENGCETFSNGEQILNVDFLPGRDDVLVIALPEGIFAIETSKTGTQNVQPIYQNKDRANFFINQDGSFYVLDESNKNIYKLLQ